MRVAHWVAPVLLTFLVVFGRGFFGAPLGWMMVIGLFIAPFVAIAMYIPPIIVVFDRDARAARNTRLAYAIATWVSWAALLVMMFTLEDGGDAPPFGSVLSTWGVMSSGTSSNIFGAALIVAFLGWVGAIVAAIVGVVQSRGRALPRQTPFPA